MTLISPPISASNLVFSFQLNKVSAGVSAYASLVPCHHFAEAGTDSCLIPLPPFQALYYFDTLFYQALGKADNKPEAPCLNPYFTVNCFLNSGPQTEITVPDMPSETNLVCMIFCVTVLS